MTEPDVTSGGSASPVDSFELPDSLRAREIFDFARARMTRVVEPHHL
jgi:hypothetical protein